MKVKSAVVSEKGKLGAVRRDAGSIRQEGVVYFMDQPAVGEISNLDCHVAIQRLSAYGQATGLNIHIEFQEHPKPSLSK